MVIIDIDLFQISEFGCQVYMMDPTVPHQVILPKLNKKEKFFQLGLDSKSTVRMYCIYSVFIN